LKIPLYQVDAFTSTLFAGNPAAVCVLESWLEEPLMQSIAAENNLSETAFLVREGEGYGLRWFTPTVEVALCGHATLASAFVLFELLGFTGERIAFSTTKSGVLTVGKRDGRLEMDFPSRPVNACHPPAGLAEALRVVPVEIHGSSEDLLVVLKNERAVREARPNFGALARIDCRGVAVTAKGEASDFVSRFFAPRVGINEDPVTGSAHCMLAPYWAQVLGKDQLHALQVSKRGGELWLTQAGERVTIAGQAVLYMEGGITV
jgi:PhzF family phenazine biosynthesis protein